MGGGEQHVQTEGHHGAAASQYCDLAGGLGRNSFYADRYRCSRERTEAGLQEMMAERGRTGLHSDEIPKAPAGGYASISEKGRTSQTNAIREGCAGREDARRAH